MMIKMANHQRDVNVAAFADGFAVVQRLEHRKEPGMLLDLAGDGIQKPRPLRATQGLPRRQSLVGGSHGSLDGAGGGLGDGGQFLAIGRVNTVNQHGVGGGQLPAAADVEPKAALVGIEPLIGHGGAFGRSPQ